VYNKCVILLSKWVTVNATPCTVIKRNRKNTKQCYKRKSHISSKLHTIYISSNNGRHLVTKTFTPLHYTSANQNSHHFTTLEIYFSFKPHPTTLYYTSLHFTQLHFILLQYVWWHFTSCHLNFIQLHFTPLYYPCRHFTYSHLNFTQPHFTTLSFGINQFKFPTASLRKRFSTYFSPFSCLSY
jgi:hypothetical protein